MAGYEPSASKSIRLSANPSLSRMPVTARSKASSCEDFNQVSEEDYNEVMQMMAEEHEALADMPIDEQVIWERKQDRLKNWLGGYSPITDGDTYNGIAI